MSKRPRRGSRGKPTAPAHPKLYVPADAEPELVAHVDAYLSRNEIPGCRCKIKKIPQCVYDGDPCPERRRTGRCDCVTLPGPPCEHVKAMAHTIDQPRDVVEWAEMYWWRHRHEYEEPEHPDGPVSVPPGPAKISYMAERFEEGFRVRHPADLEAGAADRPMENVAVVLSMTKNGRPVAERYVPETQVADPIILATEAEVEADRFAQRQESKERRRATRARAKHIAELLRRRDTAKGA